MTLKGLSGLGDKLTTTKKGPNDVRCIVWAVGMASFFLVFSSVCKSGPVRSFGPKLKDRDRDQSTFILELKKTGPDR